MQVPEGLLLTDGRYIDVANGGTTDEACPVDGSGVLAPGAAPPDPFEGVLLAPAPRGLPTAPSPASTAAASPASDGLLVDDVAIEPSDVSAQQSITTAEGPAATDGGAPSSARTAVHLPQAAGTLLYQVLGFLFTLSLVM